MMAGGERIEPSMQSCLFGLFRNNVCADRRKGINFLSVEFNVSFPTRASVQFCKAYHFILTTFVCPKFKPITSYSWPSCAPSLNLSLHTTFLYPHSKTYHFIGTLCVLSLKTIITCSRPSCSITLTPITSYSRPVCPHSQTYNFIRLCVSSMASYFLTSFLCPHSKAYNIILTTFWPSLYGL